MNSQFFKKLQNIIHLDPGVNGDAQRMEQISWILFLKLYDIYEKRWKNEAEISYQSYESIIPKELAWDVWGKHKDEVEEKDKNGKKIITIKEIPTITSDALLEFVNTKLFKALKELEIKADAPMSKKIVQEVFQDANNYMKNGVLLRDLINAIDDLKFEDKKDEISMSYEHFLLALQSAGNAGEFYTPRAVTDFVMQMLKPKVNDEIADLACGTGGFLISAFKYLQKYSNKEQSAKDKEATLGKNFYGVELKQLPYILAVTRFLINGIENPNLERKNTFENKFDDLVSKKNKKEFKEFDIIAMNPPYGGKETKEIIESFPTEFKSSETADLFMAVILERLKTNGRAAVVLPDGFLFGQDTAKINLKKRLLNDFDLHLILRLPPSVFAPYTSITTNILFFNKTPGGTQKTWFYRLDMPPNIKSFGKTKPMKLEHFEPFREWDKKRVDLSDEKGNFKAKAFSKDELIAREYNFDLCGFVSAEEEILDPFTLITQIKEQREKLNTTLDSIMEQISALIKENE